MQSCGRQVHQRRGRGSIVERVRCHGGGVEADAPAVAELERGSYPSADPGSRGGDQQEPGAARDRSGLERELGPGIGLTGAAGGEQDG